LLKSANIARRSSGDEMLRTLEVWDEQLANVGGEIMHERVRLVTDLGPLAAQEYAVVAGETGSILSLTYVSCIGDVPETHTTKEWWRDALLGELVRRRADELNRGVTLVGPHRDDLLLTLGASPAKGYASHGESWSVALALRLASYMLLRQEGVDPVLLLDDVFAELDSTRRERLAERVSMAQQVVITAAVEEDVPRMLEGAVFRVSAQGVGPT
jgi:DNA replication and repair protein RecF